MSVVKYKRKTPEKGDRVVVLRGTFRFQTGLVVDEVKFENGARYAYREVLLGQRITQLIEPQALAVIERG